MDCKTLVTYLSDYIDNNLSAALSAEAEAHLRTCANCRVVLDSTQQLILLYREQQQPMPAQRHQALYARLEDLLKK